MENTLTAHKLGQILDHSFKMTIKNYRRYFLPVTLYFALTSGLMEYMYASNSAFFSALDTAITPEAAAELLSVFSPGPYYLSTLLILLITPFFQFILNDLAIAAFFVQEEQWTPAGSAERAVKRYLPMLGAMLLTSLLIMGGTFVFLVGALVVALFLSLIFPVLVYEKVSAKEALLRSFNLIKDDFFSLAGYWIVFWMIFFGIYMLKSVAVDFLGGLFLKEGNDLINTVVYYFLNLPVVVFAIGLQSCFTVNMYFNQRIKKEEFDLE
ncbi:MAG: glycerophosphoryl diester phosphodiesterase membrane domain-containing protein [Spirochaetales bacterium]|nr:glycerophosphoryl diester phosphodiesterase membrane domain-containing protein [Spirochaetales bacterium]